MTADHGIEAGTDRDPEEPDGPRLAVPQAATATEGGADPGEQVVTLAEERATVSRRVVETGIVRIRTETEVIDHIERATLGSEQIEVEHCPVNSWVDAMPPVRQEGEVTIIPVVEERLVVEKRLFVTEEVHVRRVRSTEPVELPVTLKRQRAVVERLAPAADADDAPADDEIDLNQ